MLDINHISLRLSNERFEYAGHMETGSFNALVGPSGGGKSTLINIIAGFIRPEAGKVIFNQQDITHSLPETRPLSVLFQDHNLFPNMSVFNNIAIGISPALRLKPDEKIRIEEAVEQVGLQGFENRLPGALSGGQKQRCAIARCLVRKRPLLLLDEPFSALDPGTRLDMLQLINEMRNKYNITVLMVSHQPSDMHHIADRIFFLANGKIQQSYAPSDFFGSDTSGKTDDIIQHYLYGKTRIG